MAHGRCYNSRPARGPISRAFPRRHAHFSLIALALAIAGCSGSDMFRGSDANMRNWFEWGTEIKLPADAQYLSGRDYSAWGSVVCMGVHVPPGFKEVLKQRLNKTRQRTALSPPLAPMAMDCYSTAPSLG
jgi:hypothetical protein